MTPDDFLTHATLISQGAEAKVYKATLSESEPKILLKYRFPKKYRHVQLDSALTKARLAGEARALVRCARSGVSVPAVRLVESELGIIALEWIDGISVRQFLGTGTNDSFIDEAADLAAHDDMKSVWSQKLKKLDVTAANLMNLVGHELAKMHNADIIHGDLTTSNMMIRTSPSSHPQAEIVLIDFGLSFNSGMIEDKAVDLYVLERAFSSTHPDSDVLFACILRSYGEVLGKAWDPTFRRLQEVRLRGRKRSMVG